MRYTKEPEARDAVRTESSPEGEHALDVRDVLIKVDTIGHGRWARPSKIGREPGTRQLDISCALRVISALPVEVALCVANAGVEVETAGHPSAVALLAIGQKSRGSTEADVLRGV